MLPNVAVVSGWRNKISISVSMSMYILSTAYSHVVFDVQLCCEASSFQLAVEAIFPVTHWQTQTQAAIMSTVSGKTKYWWLKLEALVVVLHNVVVKAGCQEGVHWIRNLNKFTVTVTVTVKVGSRAAFQVNFNYLIRGQ
jgi:hypothetical protein